MLRIIEPWKLSDALEFCEAIREEMKACGYIVAVYGSVLRKEKARDLDLMLVPWRPNPDPPASAFAVLGYKFGLTPEQAPPYIGAMKAWSRTARDGKGRVVDCQFRNAEVVEEREYAAAGRMDSGGMA